MFLKFFQTLENSPKIEHLGSQIHQWREFPSTTCSNIRLNFQTDGEKIVLFYFPHYSRLCGTKISNIISIQ